MLSSMGEKFRSHLSSIGGGAINADHRGNLIETTEYQRSLAGRAGEDLALWNRFLSFLDGFGANAAAFSEAAEEIFHARTSS